MTTHPVRRPPTRADVARYAGVSGAVVSYVINNGPRPVAAETAERVRAAIDILGYRPNLTARALKRGSTQILGMILSDISNPFFAEFAVEVENTAAARGHAVLIGNSHGNAFTERRLIDDLMSRQVAGLVLASVGRPTGNDRPGRESRHPHRSRGLPVAGERTLQSRPRFSRRGSARRRPSDPGAPPPLDRHGRRRRGQRWGPPGTQLATSDSSGGPARRTPGPDAVHPRGRLPRRSATAGHAEPARPRSSPAPTCKPSGSSAPSASGVCECPRTWRWSSFDGTQEAEFCWPPADGGASTRARHGDSWPSPPSCRPRHTRPLTRATP